MINKNLNDKLEKETLSTTATQSYHTSKKGTKIARSINSNSNGL